MYSAYTLRTLWTQHSCAIAKVTCIHTLFKDWFVMKLTPKTLLPVNWCEDRQPGGPWTSSPTPPYFLKITNISMIYKIKDPYFLEMENKSKGDFATNSDFLISKSLQPNSIKFNVVDLWYFKLWIMLNQIISVWNI